MSMQEDVEQRSVVLATKAAKITGRCLAQLMRAALNKVHKSRNCPAEGKQSVRQLAKGGALQNIEITGDNIKAFEPFARKFGISYALQKDISETPPKWLVFFQSKDTACMTAAFKAFSAQMLNRENSRQPVRDAMAKAREIIKNTVRDVIRHKTRGEHER